MPLKVSPGERQCLLSVSSARFAHVCRLPEPGEILADEEFVHLGVMGVFHSDGLRLKVELARESGYFSSVVVRHQNIPFSFREEGEQAPMINLPVRVEPPG